MPRRPCIRCGTPTNGTRCPPCQQTKDRDRNTRRTQYHGTWTRRSAQARAAWIAEHGMTCPGIDTPPHPTPTLTLDHTTGLVLCPSCNVKAGPADHTAAIPHPPR